jgi:murein DD-endopeptidase MepM/ murein hydrolase activator NlpD
MLVDKKIKITILLIFLIILPVFFVIFTSYSNAQDEYDYDSYNFSQENSEIKRLNGDIENKKETAKNLQKKQEQYQLAIQEAQEQAATLDSQLSILENRIAKAGIDIERTETQIDRTELEIQKFAIGILDTEHEIDTDKSHVENILKMLSKKDSQSSLEILLTNNSFSDFINEVQYLEDINKEVGKTVAGLKDKKIQLERQKKDQEGKREELLALKKQLEDNKNLLAAERENQGYILEETKMSEDRYQRMLSDAKAEQTAASADIASLERTVREKVEKLNEKRFEITDKGLSWPVPKNTITAYFHDPDYPFRNIFEHPAIDIRAKQGTAVVASASGYIARAKDGGKTGYSYIMIVHADGLSTVYGHVTRIDVKEDDFVMQGQVIGLSGGMPGTHGAGRLTTGSHLHFEVRKDGIPVNALEYLP